VAELRRQSSARPANMCVGIDVVDGPLTEINVTSPTGLRELEALTGTDPAGAVIRRLERGSSPDQS
jgi:glutathione synthase/RimK-type ligase-like ATP-grasp enzyme